MPNASGRYPKLFSGSRRLINRLPPVVVAMTRWSPGSNPAGAAEA
jgi:hypothetical protein